MTITSAQEAFEAMRSHHRLLSEQLGAKAAAVSDAATGRRAHDAAVADLVAYLAEEVLPHAIAEEETIYPAVAARGDLVAFVSEMAAEHGTLSSAAEALAGLAEGSAAAGLARQIADLFAAHAAKENEVLLPALMASDDVDLAALLAQLHRRAEEAARTGLTRKMASPDSQGALLGLLLESARALARTGQADLACRMTAAAWTAVREDRPDLAVTVTAALHGLTRRISAGQPQDVPAAAAEHARVCAAAGWPELDVRKLPPAQRHETIFASYHDLAPGGAFVLVNDHDPKPLRYQFEAEHAGQFTWESVAAGPEVWRVRIGRVPAATPPNGGQAGPDGQVDPAGHAGEPDLDVRQVAHWQRHDVIFTAYRALTSGAGFVLVNDHDPLPLRYQFEAQYPGEFTWDYLQTGPETWRVRIGRALESAQ